MPPHILYVEDDESLGFVTRDNLELQGYTITHCVDGRAALEAIAEKEFDLCILDVMLPEIDGFEVAREIRKTNQQIPILFLTAKSMKEDRLTGLRIGGDDYITKPFSIEELRLKIDIFLRRRMVSGSSPNGQFRLGLFELDHDNLQLTGPDNTEQQLTQREADLLRLFAEHPNQILKRAMILERLWGENDYFLGRSLDVFISRLRKYLRPDERLKIENIHGVGFRFAIDEMDK